jgi:hypothetical protein
MPYKDKEVAKQKSRERYAGSQEVRDKQQAATKKWLESKPRTIISDSLRGWALNYRYKMTIEEYESLLASQGGHCALCEAVQGDDKRRMGVDHSHTCCASQKGCGRCNRGILCANCNRRVGFLEEVMREALVIPRAGTIKTLGQPETWTSLALAYLSSYDQGVTQYA